MTNDRRTARVYVPELRQSVNTEAPAKTRQSVSSRNEPWARGSHPGKAFLDQSSFNYVNRVAESFRRSPSVTHLQASSNFVHQRNWIHGISYCGHQNCIPAATRPANSSAAIFPRRTRKLKPADSTQTLSIPSPFPEFSQRSPACPFIPDFSIRFRKNDGHRVVFALALQDVSSREKVNCTGEEVTFQKYSPTVN